MKYLNKILAYAIYLLAFLLTLQTRYIIFPGMINFGYFEYGTYSLYAIDFLAMLILSLWMIKVFTKTEEKIDLKNKYLYFLAALEFFAFLSIWNAPDKILALYKYGVFLLGLGLFLMFKTFKAVDKLKLIYSFLAGVFLQALLGIYQFIVQSTFACKYLGLAAHLPATPGVAVLEIYRGGVLTRWLRAYGGLDHPNMLGALMMVGIFLVLGLLIKKNHLNLKERRHNLFLSLNYFLLFIFSLALLFSFSRAAWLGTLGGSLIIFLLNFKKIFPKRINFKSLETKLIVIFGLLIIIVGGLLFNLLGARFNFNDRLEKISVNERLASFPEAEKIIAANFWLGVGVGNYPVALFLNNPTQPSYYYQPVPNVFVLVLAETGIFGFLSFLGFLFWLVIEQIKKWREREVALAILFGFLVLMMVDHWLFSLHFGVFFFWSILGMIL